ncbi:MAG: hypothetical protein AVDCRST_MAG36-613 [uncultured Nocardioidaceae bacterium]|uniref:Uncharacterized protein n=1 Tax=uncultured Nocardioidaceae bacterium TaxID=253824 RepID=A0A6J4L7G9_9ACTN|nr:MAG: hypothetical protein AVDCRST_MAG36-613 [uncultured Nocardioidaceae bacterium]
MAIAWTRPDRGSLALSASTTRKALRLLGASGSSATSSAVSASSWVGSTPSWLRRSQRGRRSLAGRVSSVMTGRSSVSGNVTESAAFGTPGVSSSVTTSARPRDRDATRSPRSPSPSPETLVVIPIGTARAAPYIFWLRRACRAARPSSPSIARCRLCSDTVMRPSWKIPRRGVTRTRSIASQGRPRHWLPSRIRTPISSATSNGVRESSRPRRNVTAMAPIARHSSQSSGALDSTARHR